MQANQLWYALMYGVGVFVTCNVGGQILMRQMAAKPKRKACPVEVIKMSAEDMADFEAHVRRFMENRRQVDAGRADENAERNPDADAESDANTEESAADEAESNAAEESHAASNGNFLPYDKGRHIIV